MNSRLERLHPYPFEKLKALLERSAGVASCGRAGAAEDGGEVPYVPLDLSIGEPKHPVPPFVLRAMADALEDIGLYPTTRGARFLRQAAAEWLERRFHLEGGSVDPDRHVLPVNGTREALFSIAQAVVDAGDGLSRSVHDVGDVGDVGGVKASDAPYVLLPNPFYQIYEGATFMAGATPYYVACTASQGFLPDYHTLPPALLDRTALLYLCSPANPTGAVFPLERLMTLIELAKRHDFVIASDECYSEIWYDQPPPGLLQAAQRLGDHRFTRCLVFHSLSKRSNMPGARSGFVAGDAALLERYFRLRTYTGCAMPLFVQRAATLAWRDERHVQENREAYQQKLEEAIAILSPVLPVKRPDAGFYLWLQVPGGGEAFARRLYEDYNVTVLPGAYLGRMDSSGSNPGAAYVRVAMVAPRHENRDAMRRIAACARSLRRPLP